jgi:hypothetical protein
VRTIVVQAAGGNGADGDDDRAVAAAAAAGTAAAGGSASPIPARFCRWMTDLMAAGFVLSYFAWLALLLVG